MLAREKLTSEDEFQSGKAYTSLLRDCIRSAKKEQASDIHLEPVSTGLQIRLRINGDLIVWKFIGESHRQSFIQEAKRLCRLQISKADVPQDGRISLPNMKLDLRVNLLPTLHGEKIVLRLLDYETRFQLKDLDLLDDDLRCIKSALTEKSGVVLISGPTGSGKTRTLFSMLNEINQPEINITTLEDPIEYQFQGMNQVQVSSRVKFSDALRAVLRQDPDVIMVGEVRDEETANLCFKAAATGHLVLSTLHANSATQVISRLRGLGVSEQVVQDNLRLSLAQRLVKRLCRHCSIPSVGSSGRELNPRGCTKCRHGIAGRLPVLEWVDKAELVQAQTQNRQPVAAITLRESCLKRVSNGEVDRMEVSSFE